MQKVTLLSLSNLLITNDLYFINHARKFLLFFTILAILGYVPAYAQYIVHVAGNDSTVYGGSIGDGGPALNATMHTRGICADAAGNLYVSDGAYRVRKIAASTGIITSIAGGAIGTPASRLNNIPATDACLYTASGLCIDHSGNLLIADGLNRIRKVDLTTGIITSVAGCDTCTTIAFSGDGGPATAAVLNQPSDVAVDTAGDVYVVDQYNSVVRKVTMSTGIIQTVAGNAATPGYGGDGGAATAAMLDIPSGIYIDSRNNLIISDAFNNAIRKVDAATGIIHTVAGGISPGWGAGGFSGDGGPATAANLSTPVCTIMDPSGNLYISDAMNNRIRKVNAVTGIITTYAGNGTSSPTPTVHTIGNGGPATAAELENYGICFDACGDLLVAGYKWVRAITATPSLPVSGTLCGYSISYDVDPSLSVHESTGNNGNIRIYPNPNNGTFSVMINGATNEPVQIIVTDILGQQIKEITTTTNKEVNVMLDAPKGIYLITSTTTYGRQTKRVLIQ